MYENMKKYQKIYFNQKIEQKKTKYTRTPEYEIEENSGL